MKPRPVTEAVLTYPFSVPAQAVADVVGCSLQQVYHARREARRPPAPTTSLKIERHHPRMPPRLSHCIHASLYQGKLHECGKPTENGAQRCTEHRACGPHGSRFHSVKTIRHTA